MASTPLHPFGLRRRTILNVHVVAVVGDLDARTAPALKRRLASLRGPLVLDLHRCSFVTAPGCAPLFAYHRDAPVAVACARGSAIETALLRMTAGALPIDEAVADAVHRLRGTG